MAIKCITATVAAGVRQKSACEVVGITSRTLQNWRTTGTEDRRKAAKKVPANKLSQQEQDAILNICNGGEFKSQSPRQVVPALADRGIARASSTRNL